MEEIEKRLTGAEVWYGFLRVPAKLSKLFPNEGKRLNFVINGDKTTLNYRPEYGRLFGLTTWYKRFKVKEGHKIKIRKLKSGYEFLI